MVIIILLETQIFNVVYGKLLEEVIFTEPQKKC